jgi:CheY-like chemotaxis protein
MDAHMPIVDGFEATELIRADKTLDHLLVVALSGDTAADDIKKMKNVGMQEYLEKPLKIDKLYDILYAYIDIVNDIKLNSSHTKTSKLLHVEEGIEICGGDEELFKEILSEFLDMYEDTDKKIKFFIAKDDVNSAKKLLLDISGISANIGANKLSEVSTQLREALNNDEKNSLFDKEEKFTQTLLSICTEIRSYL